MAEHAPIGGVDYPETFQAFRDWFVDDDACLDYLEQLRWPSGFVCPVCQAADAWRVAGRMWMCAQCGRKTSVTAGTGLPPLAHPDVDVVRGLLAPHLTKDRDLRPRAPVPARLRLL